MRTFYLTNRLQYPRDIHVRVLHGCWAAPSVINLLSSCRCSHYSNGRFAYNTKYSHIAITMLLIRNPRPFCIIYNNVAYEMEHYIDVIMTTMASQITSLTVVYSTVYSDADQRKHQSSTSLAFVWEIHRDRWIPRTKGQLRGKCFHLMTSSWMHFEQ